MEEPVRVGARTRTVGRCEAGGYGGGCAVTPDKVQARKMVLVSALLLAVLAVYRDRKNGAGDLFHSLWGVGVFSMLLSLVADFAPTIAGPFALLALLGSLASGGSASIIDKLFGGAPAPAGSTPSTGLPKGVTSSGSAASETAASPGRS